MRVRVPSTVLPRLALTAALTAVLATVVAAGSVQPAWGVRRPHQPRYRAPVEAPVRDPFRPPACAWCPGNRGLEYAPTDGQAVRAAAGGTVAFAGQVGGELYVVVNHPDGLRTTYGLLSSIAVGVGAMVGQGEVVGVAGPATFFGVRRGDVYLDPSVLLGGAVLVPRLVPTDGGAGRWP